MNPNLNQDTDKNMVIPVIRKVLTLLITLLSLACGDTLDDLKSLDNIEVPIITSATIQKGTTLESVLGGFPQLDAFTRVDLSQQQAFADTGYSSDNVDQITLKTLTMKITAPDNENADLSFLGAMRFYVQANNLPRLEMASAMPPQSGEREITFETVDDDLKSYLLEGGGEITIELDDARRPEVDTTIEIKVIFDVDINLI
ncbi:MAG: hypothetical protein CMH49_06745 [Myxococcales bacterium]|nr:hypothetical protein [Myxococcales bacterium]